MVSTVYTKLNGVARFSDPARSCRHRSASSYGGFCAEAFRPVEQSVERRLPGDERRVLFVTERAAVSEPQREVGVGINGACRTPRSARLAIRWPALASTLRSRLSCQSRSSRMTGSTRRAQREQRIVRRANRRGPAVEQRLARGDVEEARPGNRIVGHVPRRASLQRRLDERIIRPERAARRVEPSRENRLLEIRDTAVRRRGATVRAAIARRDHRRTAPATPRGSPRSTE